MQTTTIVKGIKSQFGSGLITQTQVGEFMGLSRNTTKAFCTGLDYCKVGTKKLYTAEDVAARIMERRMCAE